MAAISKHSFQQGHETVRVERGWEGISEIDPARPSIPNRLVQRHICAAVKISVHELRIVHKDDLMTRPSEIGKDVLEDTQSHGIRDLCAKLLADLTAQRVNRQLPEFNSTSERAQKCLPLDIVESLRNENPRFVAEHADYEMANRCHDRSASGSATGMPLGRVTVTPYMPRSICGCAATATRTPSSV